MSVSPVALSGLHAEAMALDARLRAMMACPQIGHAEIGLGRLSCKLTARMTILSDDRLEIILRNGRVERCLSKGPTMALMAANTELERLVSELATDTVYAV